MQPAVQVEVTGLLLAWSRGDETALDKLVPMVYDELHRQAHHYMCHERTGHTLQTTALVHETYQRLLDTPRVRWRDRTHFFAICAQLMRRILVDHARSRGYLKRGGGMQQISLEDAEAMDIPSKSGPNLVAIDAALTALAAIDPRKTQVVELRFFGGFTVEETAEVLGISRDTVHRDWNMAKVWLLRELSRI